MENWASDFTLRSPFSIPASVNSVADSRPASEQQAITARTIGLTALAMTAFAANSILCRMALGKGAIDPAGYTAVRFVTGAAVLSVVHALNSRGRDTVRSESELPSGGSWRGWASTAA